jgi:hypothetical protein
MHRQTSRLRRCLRFLASPIGRLLQAIAYAVVFYALWQGYVDTFPRVTPQTLESSLPSLHFKIEDASSLFDMKNAAFACYIIEVKVDGATKDAPVTFTQQSATEGRAVSTEANVTVTYGHPVDFPCGVEGIFKMEQNGKLYAHQEPNWALRSRSIRLEGGEAISWLAPSRREGMTTGNMNGPRERPLRPGDANSAFSSPLPGAFLRRPVGALARWVCLVGGGSAPTAAR